MADSTAREIAERLAATPNIQCGWHEQPYPGCTTCYWRENAETLIAAALADAEARVRQEGEKMNPRQPISDEEASALHQTMDGSKWANAFCRATGFPDEGWALSWFCNAIMAGYDDARRGSDEALSARLATAEQERDEAKASEERQYDQSVAATVEMLQLRDKLATAEQALKDYGRHKADCRIAKWQEAQPFIMAVNRPDCTCGLSAALGDPQ